MKTDPKRVYLFGNCIAEGNVKMKKLLGGKGANLAEMDKIGISVPPGFTITTEFCKKYEEFGVEKVKRMLLNDVQKGIRHIENIMGEKFGGTNNPLLVSVRSGAPVSMPGMMDTVLNLGLNDGIVDKLAELTGNERFAWDSYRRLIQMFGDVVLGMKPKRKEEDDPFEAIIKIVKYKQGIEKDIEFKAEDLKELVIRFKEKVKKVTWDDFPQDPWEQLWKAIFAVFESWNTERAIAYRKANDIPDDLGTAVNVQAMVFGNMGDDSASGVGFTRDSATGENVFNGDFLPNAQGEDVVAGIRDPQRITLKGSQKLAKLKEMSEQERKTVFPSLEELMPGIFKQLLKIAKKLDNHYKDMQDFEFTIQEGKLWMLQTRTGKRTGHAMVRIAMEILEKGSIDEKAAILRIEPNKLNELLHPIFVPEALKSVKVIAKGLPASPGAAIGKIVLFSDEAKKIAEQAEKEKRKESIILVRTETSAKDFPGMNASRGILTAQGGMTSHAALVARGMGTPCVCGAGGIRVDYKSHAVEMSGKVYHEGDIISLNGTTGEVYKGEVETKDPELSGNFDKLMKLCEKYTKMYVRANADNQDDAKIARFFGAKGIGLCRTEHMFGGDDRLPVFREMILAKDKKGRQKALDKLLPIQEQDFKGIFRAMDGYPVTIRFLDPPLHEFLPKEEEEQKKMAKQMNIPIREVKAKVEELSEVNPMLGHRGCRLGITYPEISEMQTCAIIEAAFNVKAEGIIVKPEIMIPLVGFVTEFEKQEKIVRATAEKIFKERNDRVNYSVGTMIEIPRACMVADEIAKIAEFFSFGTNDLTQMTCGFSRDDAGNFLGIYIENGVIEVDPFQVLDQIGVGQLVEMGVKNGRKARPDLKVGICGEHGGEPNSIKFCHEVGMDYVSCSPYRVPIARLAAAQAAIEDSLK